MSRALFLFLLVFAFLSSHTSAQRDEFILAPDVHGEFELSDRVTLVVGYDSVPQATRLEIGLRGENLRLDFDRPATLLGMLFLTPYHAYIADTPGEVAPLAGDYLIYFDTVQVFAQSIDNPAQVFGLGMLENFSWRLPINHQKLDVTTLISAEGRHTLVLPDNTTFISAAHLPRYEARFAGQNLGHPATFQFLGWARAADLPTILRGMLPDVPVNLPLPGAPMSAARLWLPFDCSHDWLVSWGYHFSTQQNRYALDFTSAEGVGLAEGLPVRAAHDGTLYLKQFGELDALLDLGLAARVVMADGVTSTEYGHLHLETLDFWRADSLPPFEWIEIGRVKAGDILGLVGNSGYTTGAHIHFVVWTYDQSLNRPLFDGVGELAKGMVFPANLRLECDRYEKA